MRCTVSEEKVTGIEDFNSYYLQSEVTREMIPSLTQLRLQQQQLLQLQQQQQPLRAENPLRTMTMLQTRQEDSQYQHQEPTVETIKVLTITFARTRTELWTTTVMEGETISAQGGLMRWLTLEMSCSCLLKLNSGGSHIVAFSGEAKPVFSLS